MFSSASIARTPRAPGRAEEWGSGSRSSPPSHVHTAAPSPRSRSRARARRSRSSSRSPRTARPLRSERHGEAPVPHRDAPRYALREPDVVRGDDHGRAVHGGHVPEQLEERRLAASTRPFERDELTGRDLEVDAVERANRRRPPLEELRHAVERIELHYSICLSASAGRRRAARSAPAAPAIKPPRSARAKPVASTPAPTGALSDPAFVAVRRVPAPRSENPPPVP